MTGTAKEHTATGYDRLHNPRLNKGTAFTEAERRSYRIEGFCRPLPFRSTYRWRGCTVGRGHGTPDYRLQ
jgi:hypothetical protein